MENKILQSVKDISVYKFAFLIFSLLLSVPISAQRDLPEDSDTKKTTSKKVVKPEVNLADFVKATSGSKSGDNTNGQLNLDGTDYIITSEHVSSVSGIHHQYIRQAINGIEVYGTESSIHRDSSGEVLVSYSNFVDNIQSTLRSSADPALTATMAINSIASQMGYAVSDLQELERKNTPNRETRFNKAGISTSNIPAKLMYYYREGIGTDLVWEIAIEEINSSDYWNFRVDATSGLIIDKDNFTVSCISEDDHNHGAKDTDNILNDLDCTESTDSNDNKELFYTVAEQPSFMVGSYNVIAMPDESPQHGTMGRQVIANPDNATASPYGWHDTNGAPGAESNYTIGNNVDAYDDRTSTTSGTGSGTNSERAFGGAGLVFNDSWDPDINQGTDQSIKAAVTNLFYWSNIIHDVMYLYGFDEASGNFQVNNYGNGGAGNDSVRGEAQDGSGTCNANFSTPTDGGRGRMQMYVCGNRDGDFDNGVIVHEYGHGISTRLTGGAGNSGCLNNAEQQGEGWSDYFGLMLTLEPGDTRNDSRGIGTWLVGQGPNGGGIRTYPYTTDMAVNSHTYDDINTEAIPHGVGSVWAAMLWDMTWDLIDEHGFDADIYNGTGGNNIALNLVMEGLKLQPCSPGFVDSRDAILLADQNIYGGANSCIIWDAFARRGLGFSANQGSSASRSDGTEAFDLPPGTAAFANSISDLCITEGIQSGLGGGTPTGGVYSGAGVTDDGNGTSYTFDPSAAGVGTATITYTVNDACTGGTVNLDDTIEVTDGNPELICEDITVALDGGGNATIQWPDVVSNKIPGGYNHTLVAGNSLETMTGSDVGLGDDAITAAIPIGFDFEFYGTTYSDVYICSNGFVSFSDNAGMTAAQSRTPQTLPDATLPNNHIALFWGDLDPSAGGTIKFQTFGTAPNRKFVVEYLNVRYWNQTDTVSGQLQLYEGSNLVEIHLISVDYGNQNKTMGIENSDGTDALTNGSTNNAGWSTSNPLLGDFTPQPDSFATNCGNTVSLSLSKSAFTCKDVGENSIVITADDGNGGISTCIATVTVTGNPTTYSGGSWDNGVPNLGSSAKFSSDYDMNNGSNPSIDACSCEIDPGTTVTVGPDDYLNVDGNINVDGTLIVNHTGSVVQIDGNAVVNKNTGAIIEVQLTTPPLKKRD
ncbi:MAG: hypothetical protein HKO61_07490, partial [Flavobacteriaceae bacterium]|nr:hypothetical protein [Flavobacteriaceae bacterium]